MNSRKVEAWCDRACRTLYYPPDREDVRTELTWHLEDSCLALEEQGLSPEEAAEKALTGMGSADDVGRLLRRVHKPWLGWLLLFTSLALALVVLIALVSLIHGGGSGIVSEIKRLAAHDTMTLEDVETQMEARYGDYELVTALEWDRESVLCGRYTFEVTGAWLMHDGYYDRDQLWFCLEYRSPRFWLGRPEGFSEFFCVEESGGAVHSPTGWPSHVSNVSLSGNWGSTAWGTIEGRVYVDGDAEWFDLHYAHGQGFTLRLTVPEA